MQPSPRNHFNIYWIRSKPNKTTLLDSTENFSPFENSNNHSKTFFSGSITHFIVCMVEVLRHKCTSYELNCSVVSLHKQLKCLSLTCLWKGCECFHNLFGRGWEIKVKWRHHKVTQLDENSQLWVWKSLRYENAVRHLCRMNKKNQLTDDGPEATRYDLQLVMRLWTYTNWVNMLKR